MIGDTLLVGAQVLTAAGVIGDAIHLRNDRVVAVGDAAELGDRGMREERYAGATIVPGLVDAHFHPSGYTAALTRLNLTGAASFDELVLAIETVARETQPGVAIIGTRLDDEHLEEKALPTRSVLDAATQDHPVLLYRYCGHVASANTAALDAAGVGSDTSDPFGGSLDRDASGQPDGVLRETAIDIVARVIGDRTAGQTPDELNRALRGLVQQGLTRLGAIIRVGEGVWCGVGDELELLCDAAPEAPLPMSVFVAAETPADLEQAAERLERAGPRLRFAGLKIFADGSLGGHTAAMYEPFHDQPEQRGTMRLAEEAVDPVVEAAISLGGGVAIHAIGDRANGVVLDYLTEVRQRHPGALLRIEHASVLTQDDFERFAEINIVASVQPAFIASETDWLAARVGPARLSRTYAFRTLADAGAVLAGGSDCPVEPPDPRLGMAAARDRSGVVPEQGLSGSEALGLYTDGAHAALSLAPPLTPGSKANFTIFDGDPVSADATALRRLPVLSTWIDGDSVPVDGDALIWD